MSNVASKCLTMSGHYYWRVSDSFSLPLRFLFLHSMLFACYRHDGSFVYIYLVDVKLRKNFIKNFAMEIVSILKDRNFCEDRETVQIFIYYITLILSLVKVVDRQLYQRIASWESNKFITLNLFIFFQRKK